MRNYQRYSRPQGRSFGARQSPSGKRPVLVVLILLALVGLAYLYSRAGKKVPSSNANLASNVNTTAFVSTLVPAVTVAACPNVVSAVSTTQKVVALTYDVGTVAGDTSKTVPAVKAASVPAAFFVTGKLVENDQATAQLIHDAGFPLYNHSYDNLRFSKLSAKEVQAQLQATDDLIRGISGVTTKPYARIPYGDSTAATLTAMHEAGYCGLTWTVDGLDIESTATADSVTQRVVRYVKPGAIILLHAGSDLAAAVTPRIVTQLQQDGYRFVTLDDLFRAATSVGTNTNGNQT